MTSNSPQSSNQASSTSNRSNLVKLQLGPNRFRLVSKETYNSLVRRKEVVSKSRDETCNVHFSFWKPITLEHINVEGEESLTFNRKKDLQDYCTKHKLRSGALGNDA